MRRLILFFLTLISVSCVTDDKIVVDDTLKRNIEKIIVSYSDLVSKSDNNLYDPEIYEVTFKEYEGVCYVVINTNNIYNSGLDGFIFINKKLVTFNNTSSECNDGLVKINHQKTDLNRLKGFMDETGVFDIYDPSVWEFKIENGNLIPQGKESD